MWQWGCIWGIHIIHVFRVYKGCVRTVNHNYSTDVNQGIVYYRCNHSVANLAKDLKCNKMYLG